MFITKSLLYVLAVVLCFCQDAFSQASWTLQKQSDGISVYSRPSKTTRFNDVKVELDMKTSMAKFVSVMSDVNKYPLWVYETSSSSFMACSAKSQGTCSEIIYHSEVSAPWPFSNRDLYAKLQISHSADQKTTTFSVLGMPNYKPAQDGTVRIPWLQSNMVATTISPTTLHIVYTTTVDTGGDLPGWLVNMFSTTGPIESFAKLRELCKLPLAEK